MLGNASIDCGEIGAGLWGGPEQLLESAGVDTSLDQACSEMLNQAGTR